MKLAAHLSTQSKTKYGDKMNEGIIGIIGVVIGSLLGTFSTILLDRINRFKRLYIDSSRIGFSYPTGQYSEEPLTGRFSLYLYNDSSLPKTFLLEHLKLDGENIFFTVLEAQQPSLLASATAQQIGPNNALRLIYDVVVHPDVNISIPIISDKQATLKYRVGKRSLELKMVCYYFSVE